jgi:hypothetical protein
MRLIYLGPKLPVAVEFEWQLARDQREAKAKLKQFKRKWYGRVVGDGGDIALGEDTGAGDRASNVLCGATLVAMAAPQAFVYHALPAQDDQDQEVWICGIRDGLPLHGFDAILPVADARAKYIEFVSFNSAAQVYGNLNEAKESLEQLVERVPDKQRKHAVLVRHGISAAVLAVLMCLPFALGALLFSYYKFEEARERERLSTLEMIKRRTATEAHMKRLADMKVAFDAEVAAKKFELQMQAEPARMVDIWVDTLSNQVPLSFKGWQPLTANCVKTVCTLTWRPTAQALPAHIPELPGEAVSTTPNAPTTALKVQGAPLSTRQRVNRRFDLDLLSFGKATGTVATVTLRGEPRVVQVTPPQELAQQGVAPVPVGTVGQFAATFTNLVAVREFARWIEPYAVVIDRMEAAAFAPNVGTAAYHIEGQFVVAEKVEKVSEPPSRK